MAILTTIVDGVLREAVTLASVGFALGGLDDLLVDCVYGVSRFSRRHRPVAIETLATANDSLLAIFIAAWDESAVIGDMLRSTLARFGGDTGYRLYVGTYPNDRATIDAVAAVAEADGRVRLVINPRFGPTTKADCLNRLWDALLCEEETDGHRVRAVALHDAEDVVHPDELRVYRNYLADHDVVQLPVLPLVDPKSRFVSGHYIDEFCQAHGLSLVVRTALGAALPLAGVGCAIDREVLGRIAAQRAGEPFDAASLTEDYELGLMIGAMGGRQAFARVMDARGELVAVREFFPAKLGDAVRQKARWMTGIALSGWDRLGWGRTLDWREHWMRMRDRRGPIGVLILAAAYLALVAWGISLVVHAIDRSGSPPVDPLLSWLLLINGAMLAWRLTMRACFTGSRYGPLEALLSVPRMLVGNYIALLAVRHALWRYVGTLRGAPARWDKTGHRFPGDVGAAS